MAKSSDRGLKKCTTYIYFSVISYMHSAQHNNFCRMWRCYFHNYYYYLPLSSASSATGLVRELPLRDTLELFRLWDVGNRGVTDLDLGLPMNSPSFACVKSSAKLCEFCMAITSELFLDFRLGLSTIFVDGKSVVSDDSKSSIVYSCLLKIALVSSKMAMYIHTET